MLIVWTDVYSEAPQEWAFWSKTFGSLRPSYERECILYGGALRAPDPTLAPILWEGSSLYSRLIVLVFLGTDAFAFLEIASRQTERFDLRFDQKDPNECIISYLTQHGPWMDFIHQILGKSASTVHMLVHCSQNVFSYPPTFKNCLYQQSCSASKKTLSLASRDSGSCLWGLSREKYL